MSTSVQIIDAASNTAKNIATNTATKTAADAVQTGFASQSSVPATVGSTNSRPGSNSGLKQTGGKSSLSTGAVVGISVAIALFAIALLCGLGFFCYRRHLKRKRAHEPWDSARLSTSWYGKVEQHAPRPSGRNNCPDRNSLDESRSFDIERVWGRLWQRSRLENDTWNEGILVREKHQAESERSIVPYRYELSGRSRVGELETSANRHELDADHQWNDR